MLDKNEIASALRETGLLLKAKGENAFKAKAYITGARTIERKADDIGELIETERLTNLPGIGASLAKYITELYSTGETRLLKQLRAELPPGTAELSQIEGLTLKRIKLLSEQLNISTIAQLAEACKEGKVAELKGFGLKLQGEILQSIASVEKSEDRIRLVDALELTDELVNYLIAALKTKSVAAAGAVRRWQEEVDKIVIVAQKPKSAIVKALGEFHFVLSVTATDDSVIAALSDGISVEVFSVENLSLGLAAHTGTAAHFEQLQKFAEQRGVELSSANLKKGTRTIEVKDEEDVFKALKLNYIPPELREGEGEVELAETDDFSDLLDIDDIQGMTHCHSTFSDGVNSIEEMVRAAQKMGMSYITMTDHSPTAHYAGGLSVDRLKEQWEEIDRVQDLVKIKILKGTECDILADGQLDYPDHILEKFDIIIASIHSRYKQNEESMTKRLLEGLRNPHFKVWGHPLGRLVLKRDPIPCNVPKILEAIADAKVAIELNGDPYRMDLPPTWAKIARELGLKFVVSTDAHSTGNLHNLPFGIHMARRAGIRKHQVLNTLPVDRFRKAVRTA